MMKFERHNALSDLAEAVVVDEYCEHLPSWKICQTLKTLMATSLGGW